MTISCEEQIKLEAAIDLLTLASARLKDVIHSGADEAVESAYADLRLARVKFLEARADYQDICRQAA